MMNPYIYPIARTGIQSGETEPPRKLLQQNEATLFSGLLPVFWST
jgi:hypothetical protein